MKKLLETHPIGVAILSPTTAERLFVNRSFARMFGTDSVEIMMAQPPDESWANTDQRQTFKDTLSAGDNLVDFEAERLRLDGSTWWVLMNSHLIEFEGVPAQAIWHNDITEIVLARAHSQRSNEDLATQIHARTRELQRSEERFRNFSEVASDWFWETGPDLRFTYFSERILEVSGVPPDSHLGKTLDEIAGEDTTTDKWKKHLRDLDDHKAFRSFQYERRGADGRLKYLSSSGMPVFDDAGRFQGYIGVGSDITDQAEAADQVKVANERLAAAIETFSEPFALWDAHGRLFIGNNAFMESNKHLRGKTNPGVLYEDFVQALVDCELVADARGREVEWVKQRIEHHYNPQGAFEQRRADGRWYMIYEQRLPDGSIVTISTDITRLKKAELLLKESQSRFRDFAGVAADWYWEQDAQFRFINISEENQSMSGLDVNKFAGKTRWEVDIIEIHDGDMAAHKKQLEAHQPFSDFRCARARPDNSLLYMSISGKPIFDENGCFIGYRGAGRNITELVEAEKSLLEERDRATTANRSKSDFLANMSHELRTPLNSILGYSQLIRDELMGKINIQKYTEYADDIYRSGQHLLMVISDILDISKIEAHEVHLDEAEIDIKEPINAAVSVVELMAKSKGHTLRVELPEPMPKLRIDDRLIRQILINLLTNAIKFTPDGGHIKVYAEVTEKSGALVHVRDTGIGIAAEDYDLALEPFGQIRSAPELTHAGTGLGLSLSKKLMELHQGSLTLNSVVGEGTIVTLNFPESRMVS